MQPLTWAAQQCAVGGVRVLELVFGSGLDAALENQARPNKPIAQRHFAPGSDCDRQLIGEFSPDRCADLGRLRRGGARFAIGAARPPIR